MSNVLDDLQWTLQTLINESIAGNGENTVCIFCEMQKVHIDERCPCKKAELIAEKWGINIKGLSDYQKETNND